LAAIKARPDGDVIDGGGVGRWRYWAASGAALPARAGAIDYCHQAGGDGGAPDEDQAFPVSARHGIAQTVAFSVVIKTDRTVSSLLALSRETLRTRESYSTFQRPRRTRDKPSILQSRRQKNRRPSALESTATDQLRAESLEGEQ
jgi:hypothetical protein